MARANTSASMYYQFSNKELKCIIYMKEFKKSHQGHPCRTCCARLAGEAGHLSEIRKYISKRETSKKPSNENHSRTQ